MPSQSKQIALIQNIVDNLLHSICSQSGAEFQEVLNSIPIRVLWDSPEHDRYGDFFGIPLDMGTGGESVASDIILYASPLMERHGHDMNELRHMVKVTLMHEIGHYLGLDHGELREKGWN